MRWQSANRKVPRHVPVEVECQAWADFIYTTANTTSLASHPLHLMDQTDAPLLQPTALARLLE